MAKFICKNRDCEKFGIEEEFLSLRYRMVNGKLQATVAPCPKCGVVREELNDSSTIPITEKKLSIGKYSSASKEQKAEMLKKRSHDHFNKSVKPFKEHQLHEATAKMKEFKKIEN